MPWYLCLNLTPVCPAATHHPFPPSPPSLLSAVLLKCLTLGLYLLALIQRNGWATSETTSSNGLITYTGHWGLFVVHFEGLYKAGGVEARYASTEAISGWASVAGGNNTVLHKVRREGGREKGGREGVEGKYYGKENWFVAALLLIFTLLPSLPPSLGANCAGFQYYGWHCQNFGNCLLH